MKIIIKKIMLSLIILVILPIYYVYTFTTTFSNIYTNKVDLSLVNLIPINFDIVVQFTQCVFPISIYISGILISIIFIKKSFVYMSKKAQFQVCDTRPLIDSNAICLYIGVDENSNSVYLNQNSLFQNILITGAIGSGKTSSTIYPFLEQLIMYPNVCGLILDVKANMYSTINSLCKKNTRKLVVIEVGGKYKYNPLDKPNLKAHVLADRLVSILKLFSNEKCTDTYWFDKAGQMLTESIKLIRLYNNNYVDFIELHKIVTSPKYIEEKIEIVKQLFLNNKLNTSMQFDFNTLLTYFKNEYIYLDSKILSIILSEITRLTLVFVNDIEVQATFCPKRKEITFRGFENIFKNNEIVLLNISIGQYPNLSKIICTYLKLDYQTEILKRNITTISPSFFVCDEYQEYLTSNDANYFSLSREYMAINIVSTQSYSSLLNTLNNEHTLNVLIQSFVNKIFLRTDDIYTIEQCQKLFGKEDKIKISNSISENAQETNYNYLLRIMRSKKSNISQSLSSYTYQDNIYDTKDFSLRLNNFEAIVYLSQGTHMLKPMKIKLKPFFRKE